MWFKYVASTLLLAIICCVPTSFANEDQNSAKYPFQVSVRVDGMHQCTGTILAPTLVLTAQSCINKIEHRKITIEYDVQKPSHNGENIVPIKELYVYSEMRPFGELYIADIVLIELQTPMTYENDDLPAALLPSKDNDLAGKLVEVAGWTLKYTPSSYVIDKQTIKLKVESNETCANQLGISGSSLDNICTKYDADETTCPLFFPGATLMDDETLVGVANWYSDTHKCGVPNVYTKISHYTEWILSTMNHNS